MKLTLRFGCLVVAASVLLGAAAPDPADDSLTAQAASGMEAARSSIWLLYGT